MHYYLVISLVIQQKMRLPLLGVRFCPPFSQAPVLKKSPPPRKGTKILKSHGQEFYLDYRLKGNRVMKLSTKNNLQLLHILMPSQNML